jgi:hypothetical protein
VLFHVKVPCCGHRDFRTGETLYCHSSWDHKTLVTYRSVEWLVSICGYAKDHEYQETIHRWFSEHGCPLVNVHAKQECDRLDQPAYTSGFNNRHFWTI